MDFGTPVQLDTTSYNYKMCALDESRFIVFYQRLSKAITYAFKKSKSLGLSMSYGIRFVKKITVEVDLENTDIIISLKR